MHLPFASYPPLSLQPQTGGLRPENHRLPPRTFLPRSQLLIREDPRGTRLRNHSADAVPFLLFCFLFVPSPLGGLTVLTVFRPIMGSHLHLLPQKKPSSQVMEDLAFILPLLSFLPFLCIYLSLIMHWYISGIVLDSRAWGLTQGFSGELRPKARGRVLLMTGEGWVGGAC